MKTKEQKRIARLEREYREMTRVLHDVLRCGYVIGGCCTCKTMMERVVKVADKFFNKGAK